MESTHKFFLADHSYMIRVGLDHIDPDIYDMEKLHIYDDKIKTICQQLRSREAFPKFGNKVICSWESEILIRNNLKTELEKLSSEIPLISFYIYF